MRNDTPKLSRCNCSKFDLSGVFFHSRAETRILQRHKESEMTHDELLADIDSKNFRESRTPETPYAALRAVVELHKPIQISDKHQLCNACRQWINKGQRSWFYPCPTIQAIEKELGSN